MNEATETQESKILEVLENLKSEVLEIKHQARIPPENALWDIKDISEYIRISYKYTSEYIVSHHRFPIPIRLSTKDGRKGHPRWYAKEVMAWVQENRDDGIY